jgi:hypothetical protein
MGTTVQVKCLLRNGVLPLLLASAWVHCTLIVLLLFFVIFNINTLIRLLLLIVIQHFSIV